MNAHERTGERSRLVECSRCPRERPNDRWLCDTCVGYLADDLLALPGLWSELTTTLSRTDHITSPLLARTSGSPLPFKPEASEARWVMSQTVNTWVEHWCEHLGQGHPAAPWRWLHKTLPHFLGSHDVVQFADEIESAVKLATRTIDRPPNLVFTGPCSTQDCGGFLYAHIKDTVTRCRLCGEEHDVAQRRDWMKRAARGQRVTATTALIWVRELLPSNPVIPPRALRVWVHRGKLRAVGLDHQHHAVYLFGDVEDCAVKWLQHNRKRAAA